MNCKKALAPADRLIFIMPVGTMFWYRPRALEQITSLNFMSSEIPGEPLPAHGTVLHAIERMLVYVVW